jgi:hypothetical protein
MATPHEVQQRLEGLIARLASSQMGRGGLADALPEPRVLMVSVPDLDTSYWTALEGGRMGDLEVGDPGDAHIRVTAPSDTLVDVLDGRESLFSAYVAGTVRIDASMSDLLRLRRLL